MWDKLSLDDLRIKAESQAHYSEAVVRYQEGEEL
jgi:hypothetical protein